MTPVHVHMYTEVYRLKPPPPLIYCLYFSAATGTPVDQQAVQRSTPSSGASSTLTVAAEIHRSAYVEDDDEEYDDVVQVEEGKDGEDLEHVAAEGRFQPIHLMGAGGGVRFQPIHFNVHVYVYRTSLQKSIRN